jgi:hypothetical protein
MRPQRVRIIGSISGCVTLKEAVDGNIDDPVPLFGAFIPGNAASS